MKMAVCVMWQMFSGSPCHVADVTWLFMSCGRIVFSKLIGIVIYSIGACCGVCMAYWHLTLPFQELALVLACTSISIFFLLVSFGRVQSFMVHVAEHRLDQGTSSPFHSD